MVQTCRVLFPKTLDQLLMKVIKVYRFVKVVKVGECCEGNAMNVVKEWRT